MTEPNIDIARTWWRELPNKWTAVGWKDHLLRFNVLHNGSIVNTYAWMEKTRPPLPDPTSQMSFLPGGSIDEFPAQPIGANADFDDGTVLQGWNGSDTPVLWSEWAWSGYLLRQEVFAHVPDGRPVSRGDEPLFAWVRLSVTYACEGLPLPERYGFGIRINSGVTDLSMKKAWALIYRADMARYRHEISAEAAEYSSADGLRIVEPDGRVRMAVAPGQDCTATFRNGFPGPDDSMLYVQGPAEVGHHIDLLIPMLPTDRETFDRELALGYDGAFSEAERFWSLPSTAVTIDVPEDYIGQAIRRSTQFAEVMADKDPELGEYVMLTGAMGYGIGTWSTPVSITIVEQLDRMGHHEAAEKYLRCYKESQGKAMPPGDSFRLHEGYLETPQRLAVVNWLPDHGAILWAISEHGLLTDDAEFIGEYTPVIVKACEWIQYARRINPEGAVPGVMPPAGASDDEARVQSCWTDGWIYKGLCSAVRLLERVGHPRAAEFAAEAREYKETFVKALREKTETMPEWTDGEGRRRHLLPVALTGGQDAQLRHIFYVDTGPMFLVYSGLMDAEDELMKSSVEFFRSGPPTKLYRDDADYNHVPCIHHEVSSWEQSYSWNVFHSWKLNDRARFLEGMYSLFTGVMSQQTYTMCEERGGQSALIPCAPNTFMARVAAVDDQVVDGELHLMRMTPLAWLREDCAARFEDLPTYYGPVSLTAVLSDGGRRLDVTYSGQYRREPKRVVLHIPPMPGLETVSLNGAPLTWSRGETSVTIG